MSRQTLLPDECQIFSDKLNIVFNAETSLCSAFDVLAGKKININIKQKRLIVRKYAKSIRKQKAVLNFDVFLLQQMQRIQRVALRSIEYARIKKEKVDKRRGDKRFADILATSYSLPISKAASTPEGIATLAGLPSEKFYQTPEWKKLRLEAFALYGRKCQVCGDSPESGCILEVDHITPRYMQPQIAFDIKNLRVLCRVCHQGRTYRHNDHVSTSMDGLRGRK